MDEVCERPNVERTTFDVLEILFPKKVGKAYSTFSKSDSGDLPRNITVTANAAEGYYWVLTTYKLEGMASADKYACDVWKVDSEGAVHRTEYLHYNDHDKGAPSFDEVMRGLSSARNEGFATYPSAKTAAVKTSSRLLAETKEAIAHRASQAWSHGGQELPQTPPETILLDILKGTPEWQKTAKQRNLVDTAARQRAIVQEFMDRHF